MENSDSNSGMKQLPFSGAGPLGAIVKAVVGVIVLGGLLGVLFETNKAGHITVKQSLTGSVSIISEPGLFCQCFGTITTYDEAGTFKFAQVALTAEEKAAGKPRRNREVTPGVAGEIEVRFNDGGKGWISGMALFDLPSDSEKLSLVHKKFRGFENLMEVGIIPTIKESIILTASLMSSGESYTTKRAMLTEWARDQLEKGTYVTEDVTLEEKDHRTGDLTKKNIVRAKVANNVKIRNENPLDRYGIKFKQFQITDIRYESETEDIIKAKREALQQTIAARISAERAIQERIAAVEVGKKNVQIAEYKAMVKKKKSEVEAEEVKAVAIITAEKKAAVAKIEKMRSLKAAAKKVELEKLDKEKSLIEAQKILQVAKLSVQSAERLKRANVLEGQGLAEKKKLLYNADGALQEKLDAYVKVMTVLAKELGKQKWVPDVTMNGGGGGKGAPADGNMAMNFMNMWMMKTAKDMGVEMVANKKGRR